MFDTFVLGIFLICLLSFMVIMWIWKSVSLEYIYMKKSDKKSLGWIWSLGIFSIVRLKDEKKKINELKFFIGDWSI